MGTHRKTISFARNFHEVPPMKKCKEYIGQSKVSKETVSKTAMKFHEVTPMKKYRKSIGMSKVSKVTISSIPIPSWLLS